jgi:hypothetical protein
VRIGNCRKSALLEAFKNALETIEQELSPGKYHMARWIYQRPIDCCDPTELIVAKRLALLSDQWVIRWGFIFGQDEVGSRPMQIEKSREQLQRKIVVDSLQKVPELVQGAKAVCAFSVKAEMLKADSGQINRRRIIKPR